MRKRFFIDLLVCFCFVSACIFSAKAAESVGVSLPEFDISFNGTVIDTDNAEYPFIVYKDVTYIPVEDKHTTEYNYMSYLGFVCGEGRSESKYGKLFVRDLWFEKNIPGAVSFENKKSDAERDMTAQVADGYTGVITNRFGQVRESFTKDYPVLVFNGRNYLPMTYDIACGGLGLSVSFSGDKGLEISRVSVPRMIVSVPQFDVTLNGVRYENERAKYPLLQYNDVVFMPLTEGICDFMGIKAEHIGAEDDFYEYVLVKNTAVRHIDADPGYIKEGDSFSLDILEPFDGELYINGFGTKWHNFGMEYSPMRVGDVCYLPLTWQIAHDYLGWEYSFDGKNGLVLDSRGTYREMKNSLFEN